jgi:4-hydroxy-tetrahydrodipicolinate synthase
MAQMVGAALAGDLPAAQAINRKYYRLMQAHYWEPNPAPVKAVLAMMGHGEDRLRLPMTQVSAATRRKLEVLLGELGLLAGAATSGEKVRMF